MGISHGDHSLRTLKRAACLARNQNERPREKELQRQATLSLVSQWLSEHISFGAIRPWRHQNWLLLSPDFLHLHPHRHLPHSHAEIEPFTLLRTLHDLSH